MWSFVFYALKFTTRAHFRARIRIHEEHTHLPCRPNLYVCNKQLNVRVRTSPPAKTTHTKNIKKNSNRVRHGLFWAATDFAPYLSIDVHKNHNFPQEKLVKKCWHATIGLGSKCPKKLFPSIYSNLELMVRRDFHSFCCCWNINFVFMEVCSEFD